MLTGPIAAATAIPDPLFKVFSVGTLIVLAAAGIVIALLPAQWAPRSGGYRGAADRMTELASDEIRRHRGASERAVT
jgi:hypothetical protein